MKRLILNLSGLSGEAKVIVGEQVQLRLFKLGFVWPLQPNKVTNLCASHLILYYNNDNFLAYSVDGYVPGGEVEVYDVCRRLDAFFEAVKNSQAITYCDSGVEVIVTRNEIKLDAQTLLNKVTERAQAKQAAHFPKE